VTLLQVWLSPPHIHLPQILAILDPSVYQISPPDSRVLAKIEKPVSAHRVLYLEVPSAMFGFILSRPI
jgi:hypothetical protein